MSEVCAELEALCQAGDLRTTAALLARLDSEYERARAALQQMLEPA